MSIKYKTDQEKFWASEFGDSYTDRNANNNLLAANEALFSKILAGTKGIKSVIEFGPNIGLNLIAIRRLMPNVHLTGVEINKKAIKILKKLPYVTALGGSILDFSGKKFDLAFTKGVLIHINPDYLNKAYEIIYKSSKKYILLAEYYNPTPTEINYRGHTGKLFKRDFAGEITAKYKDLDIISYGFAYHQDTFPQDDLTWFLMEKKK